MFCTRLGPASQLRAWSSAAANRSVRFIWSMVGASRRRAAPRSQSLLGGARVPRLRQRAWPLAAVPRAARPLPRRRKIHPEFCHRWCMLRRMANPSFAVALAALMQRLAGVKAPVAHMASVPQPNHSVKRTRPGYGFRRGLPQTLGLTVRFKNPLSILSPIEVISRIQRGLCGYVSYLAACEMNEAFSEYVLYEPILRIFTASGFEVKCEHECPGAVQPTKGDRKRLDFYASDRDGLRFAIEVKWISTRRLDVRSDVEKLSWLAAAEPATYPLLCVFGKKSLLSAVNLSNHGLREWGAPKYADLGRTKYGCRIFLLEAGPE